MTSAEAEACSRRIRVLYGDGLERDTGAIHVAAAWDAPGADAPRVLRLGPGSPRSATDSFALGVARARADAIVTTGKILRDEPEVTHRPGASPQDRRSLERWRSEVLGKRSAPRSVVLTAGGDVDLDHPLFRTGGAPLIYTREGRSRRLGADARSRGIDVVGSPSPSLRGALAYLRSLGLRTISIEAGPSTALALYSEPLAVDELMLSLFHGEAPPERAVGPPLLPLERLGELLPHSSPPAFVEERSGCWSFRRLVRKPAVAAHADRAR